MSVFIELTTDPFDDIFKQRSGAAKVTRRAGATSVRRPLRGLEVKDDTYAIIKVIQADGSEIPLLTGDSADGTSGSFSSFLLQRVNEARMEKHQIVETFGEAYIYFFGEQPRFLDVQAALVNSADFNWKAEFLENYDRYFRGTRLTELGARLYLFYDDVIVEGYMLMSNVDDNADNPRMASMSFRMFVTNYSNISFVGDPNFPIRASVNLPPGVDLTNGDAFNQLQESLTQQSQNALLLELTDAAAAQQDGFGGGARLADVLRRGLSSTAFPGQDIQTFLNNASGVLGGNNGQLPDGLTRVLPLRSRIADNIDEWTGEPAFNQFDFSAHTENAESELADAVDLALMTINELNFYGADVNDPFVLYGMGLGVTFGAGFGVGIGGGLGTSTDATFGASPYGPGGVGYGLVDANAGAFASVGVGASAGISAFSPTSTDPFGAGVNNSPFGPTDQFGNPLNPFASTFPSGSGAGFQGPGAGVPIGGGFAASGISTSAFAGAAISTSTFSGTSVGASYGGGIGSGGVVMVGGAPTAFSLVSVEGELDVTGGGGELVVF